MSGARHDREARSTWVRTRGQPAPTGSGGQLGPPPGHACSSTSSLPFWAAPWQPTAPRGALAPSAAPDHGVTTRAVSLLPLAASWESYRATAAASRPLARRRPRPAQHPPALAVTAARGDPPTRPPRCLMRASWDRMEEERRLAGPGLGGMVVNEVLTKTEGRSPPCRAALTFTTVGGGREWTG